MPVIRELVFRTPLDGNQDGWPDLDVDGNMLWSAALSALVLQPGADGNNRLCLIDSSGGRRILASNVSGLVIDDSASSGMTIPLNQLRIRLTMAPKSGAPTMANPMVYESTLQLAQGGDDLW